MMLAAVLLLQALPQSIPTGCTWSLSFPPGADPRMAPSVLMTPTCPPPAAYQLGEPGILTDTDSGNAGLVLAQSFIVAQDVVLQTVSFYVENPAGSLRLGVYAADCCNAALSEPGRLLAQGELLTVVAGWNTIPLSALPSPVLGPGVYWLAFSPSSAALSFRVDRLRGDTRYFGQLYGPLPGLWPRLGTTNLVGHWSFFAQVVGLR